MERRSLMEQAGIEEKAAAAHRSKGMSKTKADKIKLAAAVSLFVVALGLIAWYADWIPIGQPAPPPPPTQEQVQQIQKRDTEIKKLEQAGKVQNAGSQ